MANTYQKILLSGNYANYKALTKKDPNVLYFCEDVGKIFKGEVDYTDHVVAAPTKPTVPVTGKIYILSDTDTVEAYINGTWKILSYPIATTIDEHSDDMHVATTKAVYDALQKIKPVTIDGVVTDISPIENADASHKPAELHLEYDNDAGSTYNKDIIIPGVSLEPKWDSTARTITIPVTPVDGTGTIKNVVMNLGRDIFIDSNAANGYNKTEKSIDLYLNDASEHSGTPTLVRIPIADLVDSIKTITGGTGNGTTSSVDPDGTLHVNLVLDPDSKNALTLSSNGLMLDLSGYVTTTDFQDLADTVDNLAEATTSWGNF